MCSDFDLLAVQRHDHLGAKERLESLVVGVSDQRHARCEQFGTGGVDLDGARSVGQLERDLVVRGGAFFVGQLGLGNCGPEVDVPEGGRFLRVGLASGDVAQEGALADAA